MKSVGEGQKQDRRSLLDPLRGRRNGWRICIAGTGGQGVLTAARLLCDAFVEQGHEVVSGQLHGMAQRGGSVQSSVMIDCGISPMMGSGQADFVLGFEPVETARALPLMSSCTMVYMNTAPVIPYVVGQQIVLEKEEAKYPDVAQLETAIRAVTDQVFSFDATQLATEAGAAKALNVLMLGCLLGSSSLPCTADDFWRAAAEKMPPASAETNHQAFRRGVDLGKKFQPAGARS